MKQAIAAKLGGEGQIDFAAALERAIQQKFTRYQSGVTRYQQHPYCREVPDVPVFWSQGSAQLREFGNKALGASKTLNRESQEGYPVFVIPSLVNRYYILDLMKENSFLRWLEGEGWHPFVMDWGAPGEAEKDYGLEDYICDYLKPALKAVKEKTGLPPIVLGYCMGGTLAVALSELCQDDIRALVLMASPWDFHDDPASKGAQNFAQTQMTRAQLQGAWLSGLLPLIEAQGQMAHELLQTLFASLDLTLSLRKFTAFTRLKEGSPEEISFVALEDWLNDGVCLTANVARECFEGWYRDNLPASGGWEIAGKTINPVKVKVPALSVISSRDRIVPSASSYALAGALPNGTVLETPLGHIGMIVSRGAQKKIWTPVSDWMKQIVT